MAIDRKFYRPDFERDGDENRVRSRELLFKEFAPGDLFYHKMTPKRYFSEGSDGEKARITAKLQYRYAGPFAVTEVLNPVTYRANINGRIKTVHANKMKRDMAQPIDERDHLIPTYFEDELDPEPDIVAPEAPVIEVEGAGETDGSEHEELRDEVDGAEWYQKWFREQEDEHDSFVLKEVQASLAAQLLTPLSEQPKKTARIPMRSAPPSHRHLTGPELRASMDSLLHRYHS